MKSNARPVPSDNTGYNTGKAFSVQFVFKYKKKWEKIMTWLHHLTTQTTLKEHQRQNYAMRRPEFIIWSDCSDSRIDLLDRLLACECDRIGGAGLCFQSTWNEPAATNGKGDCRGNDAHVVGVTHDLSMITDELSRCFSHSILLALFFFLQAFT